MKYLKEQAAEAKQRAAAREIEAASQELLGDQHFAYGREAQLLAQVDLAAFAEFTSRLAAIRTALDEQFDNVLSKLGDENEKT